MGFKTFFIQGDDCCAALAQTVHKTSRCSFHIGQISHQHLSHERSNLRIHSLKASQLGDDVLEDVFPDMVQASTFSKLQLGYSVDMVPKSTKNQTNRGNMETLKHVKHVKRTINEHSHFVTQNNLVRIIVSNQSQKSVCN